MIQHQFEFDAPAQDADIQNAVDALQELESASAHLIHLLSDKAMMQPLAVYELPLRNEVDAPDLIPVTKLLGESGRALAIEAITALRFRSDQSSRETLRVPGVLWLNPALEGEVSRLIRAKHHFETRMQSLRSPPEEQTRYHPKKRRFLQLHCARGLSLKQAYRVPEIVETLKTVSFYWDTSFSISRIKVGDLRERLLAGLNHISATQISRFDDTDRISESNRPAWQLAKDIDLLGHFDTNEVLAECWPKSPHPRAYILTEEGRHISHMSTPLIYIGQAPPESISIIDRRFKDWVSTGVKPIHSELVEEPLIERLGIYRFKAKFRRNSLPVKTAIAKRKSISTNGIK